MLHEDLPMSSTQVQIIKGQLRYIAYIRYILYLNRYTNERWLLMINELAHNGFRVSVYIFLNCLRSWSFHGKSASFVLPEYL